MLTIRNFIERLYFEIIFILLSFHLSLRPLLFFIFFKKESDFLFSAHPSRILIGSNAPASALQCNRYYCFVPSALEFVFVFWKRPSKIDQQSLEHHRPRDFSATTNSDIWSFWHGADSKAWTQRWIRKRGLKTIFWLISKKRGSTLLNERRNRPFLSLCTYPRVDRELKKRIKIYRKRLVTTVQQFWKSI